MIQRRIYKAVLCTAAALAFLATGPLPAFSQSSAATEVRLQEMEQEIRRLTGMVEEQSYEIRSLRDQLDQMTVRVRELEGGGGVASSSASSSGSSYGGEPRTGNGYDYGDSGEPMESTSMVKSGKEPRSSSFEYVPPENLRNDDEIGRASCWGIV